MANTKLSALTALTDAVSSDLMYIVDDPDGTAASRKITVANALKAVNSLDAISSPAGEDVMYVVDDPSGTPASKKITISSLNDAIGDLGVSVGTLADSAADNGSVYYSSDQSGLVYKDGSGNVRTLLNIHVSNGVATVGADLSISSGEYLYFGDPDTNGSVRIRKSGWVVYNDVRVSGSWVPKYATVYASGDTTGETDRTSIQAAIDALESSDSADGGATVFFAGGRYYIDQTISVNSYETYSTHYRVLLNGGGSTQIDVVSGFSGDYAFEIYGKALEGLEPCMSGMFMDCNYRCRGVLLYYQAYRALMDSVYLYAASGVAVDAVDCYGCTLSRCRIDYTRGMCFRGWRFNSSSIRDTKMRGWGCRSTDSNENEDMWVYDCINGRDAAIALYDGDDGYGTYTEDYLDPADETVVDTSSDYVQTSADQRCQVHLYGNNITLENVNLESSAYCSYPAILAEGSNIDCCNIRMENSYNGYCMFAVEGGTSQGRAVSFRQVQFRDSGLLGNGNKQHVVVAKTRSVGLYVADCQLRGFGGNIIYAEDGTHTQAMVERVFTQVDEIAEGNWVGRHADASITSDGVSRVRTERVVVDCSSDETGETTTLLTLLSGSIIHDVVARCTEAMDGTSTTTLEVGVSGNPDKYIDLTEFDPSSLNDYQAMTGGGSNDQGTAEMLTSDTTLIATWTNTGGTPSTGEVEVYITYTLNSP